jgi:hypothetical protein
MAYIVNSVLSSTEGATSTTFVCELPTETQQTGDYILVVALNDTGTTAITCTAGWTEWNGPAPSNSGPRCAIFYRKNTGSTLTAPTVSGTTNDDWIVTTILIRDADGTTFIDAGARTDQTANTTTPLLPSVTTTTAGCLVLRVIGYDGAGLSNYDGGFGQFVDIARRSEASTLQLCVAYEMQPTASATGTQQFTNNASDGGSLITLAITNASGGAVQPMCRIANTVVDTGFVTAGATSLHTIRTAIAGVTVNALTTNTNALLTAYATDVNWYGVAQSWGFASASSVVDMFGGYKAVTADWSAGKPFSITLYLNTAATQQSAAGYIFYFEDVSGNWKAWQPLRRVDTPAVIFRTITADLPNETFIDGAGTMDWSQIVRFGLVCHHTTASNSVRTFSYRVICSPGDAVILGGGANKPATYLDAVKTTESAASLYRGFVQGGGQVALGTGFQIGDGTNPVFFKVPAQSFEFRIKDGKTPPGYRLPANYLTYRIKLAAGSTCDLGSSIISSTDRQSFVIDAASSTSATYNFSGASIVGFNVTWKTGITCNGAGFGNCGEIDAKGAAFTGCVVTNSASTTSAMKLDAGASVVGSAFTKGAETYALRIPAAGSYDLSDATFTGYTNVINVTAASGTVTITLALGQTVPTHVTAGATVTFVQPILSTTFNLPNVPDGSTVGFYNITTATELQWTASVSGGAGISFTMIPGTHYTVGDVVEVRALKVSGVTATQEYTFNTTTSAGGGTITLSTALTPCAAYNTIGVDGSAVTGVAADYVNDEINLTVAANFNFGDVFAWWKYNLTSQQGMDEFWGAITALDAANFRVNTSVVSLYMDNTTATSIHQLDNRRFYRDDDTYPVLEPTSGGGGIDIVWKNQILIAETGTSGLTGPESAQLFAAALETTAQAIKSNTNLIPALL